MRTQWVLLPLLSGLGGLVDAKAPAGRHIRRQIIPTSIEPVPVPPPTTDDGSSTDDGPTTDPPAEVDTTTTVTTTVDGSSRGGATETSRVTTDITRTTTIIITVTEFDVTTVTNRGERTATSTVYATSTVWATGGGGNARRSVAARTLAVPRFAAAITDAPAAPTAAPGDYSRRQAEPAAHLAKRATIVVTETVTRDGEQGDDTTVVDTITRTAVSTATSRSTTTELDTETLQADATTTVTTTSTRTVTSSSVTTGISEPTATSDSGSGDDDNSNDNGGGGGGLSTGAIVGIAVGAGVGGIAVIGILIYCCWWRKRKSDSKADHDDLFGNSGFPAGAAGAGGRRTPPMASTGAGLTPTLPNVAPEGYRGTAMGDGRAGQGKLDPDPYGAAYNRASNISKSPVSPVTAYSKPTDRSSTVVSGDLLPEHSSPNDMEHSAAALAAGRHSSPPPAVARHPSPLTAAELGSEEATTPLAAELGSEGTAARWQTPGAAEIDSGGAAARYQSHDASEMDGHSATPHQHTAVYEMPAQNYR